MKLRKNKEKLQNLFVLDADYMEQALISASKSIISFCEGDRDLLKLYVRETVVFEGLQDKVRDKILERLFGREVMVFSRSDRLMMVRDMNRIVSYAERVARRLLLNRTNIVQDIADGLKIISNQLIEIANELKSLLINVFIDFKAAKINIKHINSIRHNIRKDEYLILDFLYSNESSFSQINIVFLEDLITNTAKIANYADQIADRIFGLICKYSLK